jgi:phage gp29-like protein
MACSEETVDQGKMVDVLTKAAQVGLEIDVEWAHKVMQIPRAAEGVKILQVANASPFADPDDVPEQADLRRLGSLCRGRQNDLAALARQPDEGDAAARSTARLLDDTAPAMESWLETIEAMLNAASSLEEFREMLLAAYPDLATDKVVEAMTQAFIAIDLTGRLEVEEEGRGG